MSKLTSEKSCTERSIVDLAYEASIKAIGKYSCFAPSGISSPVIVDANHPLSMKNSPNARKFVKAESSLAFKKESACEITNIPVRLMKNLGGKEELLEFVKGIDDAADQTVLVWSQGSLHLYIVGLLVIQAKIRGTPLLLLATS
ncbi:unnamed protein product [Blumeria hordei]|uniref:Uncharacterized protein n=1 Tax=Blumeria hordei TaxID=2867405 RepID=A0A383UME7_BLUHO|nr:unnamed protein product [Blumeria hordei]